MDMNIPREQTQPTIIPPEETEQKTVLESSTRTNPQCCPCDNRSYYEKAKDAARSAASSAKSMGSKAAMMSMNAASSAARVGSRAADVAARGTVRGLSGLGTGVGTFASGIARAPFMGMGGRKTRRHHGRRHKRKSGKKSRKHRHRRTRRK